MSECAQWRGWMWKRLIVARVFVCIAVARVFVCIASAVLLFSDTGGMAEVDEQRVCIKFYVRLGKTGSETFEKLKPAFGDSCMSRSRTFEWFGRFKNGRTSTANDD